VKFEAKTRAHGDNSLAKLVIIWKRADSVKVYCIVCDESRMNNSNAHAASFECETLAREWLLLFTEIKDALLNLFLLEKIVLIKTYAKN
jgi:hypothetical protein